MRACKPDAAATHICFNLMHCEHVYSGFDQAGDLGLLEQHLLPADTLR